MAYSNSGQSWNAALTANVPTGAAIAVHLIWTSSQTFSSLTDSQGNTYTARGTEITAFGAKSRIFTAKNVTGHASLVITPAFGGTIDYQIQAAWFTGRDTTEPYDSTGGAFTETTDTSSPYSAAITPSTAGSDLVAFCYPNAVTLTNYLTDASFSEAIEDGDGANHWPGAIAYLANSGTSSYDPAWTTNNASQAVVRTLALKPSGGGGGGGAVKRKLMLMGVSR